MKYQSCFSHFVLIVFSLFSLTNCGGSGSGSSSDSSGGGNNDPANPPPSSAAVQTVIGPGIECTYGGIRVDIGIDENQNGELDTDEIDSSEYVCNGSDGNDGDDGLQSLVSINDEIPGDNCEFGGLKIDIGLDSNSSSLLDDNEINTTRYICNGGTTTLVVNDDTYGFVTTATSGNTTEAGGKASFSMKLRSQPTNDVTIGISSNDTTEGIVTPGSLIFTSLNWDSFQTITITGQNDDIVDGNRFYTLNMETAVSLDENYNGLDPIDVTVLNIDDETAGFTVTPNNGIITSESGGEDIISIKLNSQPSDNVNLSFSSDNTGEGIASPTSFLFTPSNWNAYKQMTISGVDDFSIDGDQAFKIRFSPVSSGDNDYDGIQISDISVVNTDNESVGFVISEISNNTGEDGTQATFSVRLNSKPEYTVSIPVSSSNTNEGTISDSLLEFSTLNWNAPKTVTVYGVDDDVADGDQGYTIELGTVSSADGNYNGLNPENVDVTNTDNDSPGFTITSISDTTEENGSPSAAFSVRLNSKPTASVNIDVTSDDPGEGIPDVTSLNFTTSDWNSTKAVIVTGVDDNVVDGNQSFTIILGPVNSTDTAYSVLDPMDLTFTTLDDESAGFVVSPISGNTSEAGGTATFDLGLTSQPSKNVYVSVSSSDTGEGDVSPDNLVFTENDWQNKTVTVSGKDDFIADGIQFYTIELASAVSTDLNYNGLNPADVSVLNIDDETAGFTISNISGNISESGSVASFTIVLNSLPTSTVSFSLSSSDLTEGSVSPTNVSFSTSNWNVPQMIEVTGVEDDIEDGNQTFYILTGLANSSDPGYMNLNPADITVINEDNDSAGYTILPSIVGYTTEEGSTQEITIKLNTEPQFDVVIGITSSDPGEGSVSTSSVTFTPSDWYQEQTILVTGVADNAIDGNASYSIVLSDPTTDDPVYSLLNPSDVSMYNIESDFAGVLISSVSGATGEDLSEVDFTMKLTSKPTDNVTVYMDVYDLTESDISPPFLTFTSSNWNSPQTVTVTGANDTTIDGEQINEVMFTPAFSSNDSNYSGMDPDNIPVLNRDNESQTYSKVAGGLEHACALVIDGTIKCWGRGDNGRLGNGSSADHMTPVQVSGITNAIDIAVGDYHSCAVLSNGTIECWGQGTEGQLGDGYSTDQLLPVTVSGISTATTIAAGQEHSCALLSSGSVQCWGEGNSGQLGDGNSSDSNTPVSASSITTATHISSGKDHNCAILSDQSISCWGYGYSGQLGDDHTSNNPTPNSVSGISSALEIALGAHFSCARLSDQSINCWGSNSSGQLGNNENLNRDIPVTVSGISSATSLGAGYTHACAILDDESARCWGNGYYGELGNGGTSNSNIPVIVSGVDDAASITGGENFTCSVLTNGTIECWGDSSIYGKLGDDSLTDRLTAVSLAESKTAVAISAGGANSCAILSDGTAKCWGYADSGRLGNNFGNTDSRAVPVSNISTAFDIESGSAHSCLIQGDRTVKCWGSGYYGQLGNNDDSNQSIPVLVMGLSNSSKVSCGEWHSCSTTTDGSVYCWGRNLEFQLGNSNTAEKTVATLVEGVSNAKLIAAGYQHTCALINNGRIKCWGNNDNGELGNGTIESSFKPLYVTGITNAKKLDSSFHFSCAVLSNGSVQCWGTGEDGQLGNGFISDESTPVFVTGIDNAIDVVTGRYHACALLEDGIIKCWGENNNGQLGNSSNFDSSIPVEVSGISTAIAISAGDNHNCAILADGSARCWGDGYYHALGNASSTDQSIPVPVDRLP